MDFGNNRNILRRRSADLQNRALSSLAFCGCSFLVVGVLTIAIFHSYNRIPQPYLSGILLGIGGIFLLCYAILYCKYKYENRNNRNSFESVTTPSSGDLPGPTRNGSLPQSPMRRHLVFTFRARQERRSTTDQVMYTDEPPTYASLENVQRKNKSAASLGNPPKYDDACM
ncbi:uncharacterized protein LOC143461268 [Clavelina lepadiformis]|uniref:uncharacterized protein LOC143461268 n=1 Tax=Clavelina lepadiformis TaxID=159417 RepID=UPI004040FFAF